MSSEVEGLFRPNDSLESIVFRACRADGIGFFRSLGAQGRVRRMSPEQRQRLEMELGAMVQKDVAEGRLRLPVNCKVEGGRVVSGWQDLFAWFLENLPAILEMIASIMDMFKGDGRLIVGCILICLTFSASSAGSVAEVFGRIVQ